jgi:hypothetical protein
MDLAFQFDHYLVKKQILALTGILRIYNPQDKLILFCQQKFLKLKEDIRIFSDESKNRELLNIQARQIIDFSAYYDVFDSQYSTKVGGLRRKGFRSIIQDEWEVYNPQDQLIGMLKEDSLNQALLRRFLLGSLIPQNYYLIIGTEHTADFKQRLNLLRYELEIDFQMDAENRLDHRLGLATGILLAIIEGRQHSQS